jgi:hypothetical protein
MHLEGGSLHRVPPDEARRIGAELAADGWQVVVFPDSTRDGADFVSALNQAKVPLDPPNDRVRVWWALLDSLINGLDTLNDVRIAFVWPDPSAMIESSPTEYEEAEHLLSYLAGSGPKWAQEGRPRDLLVVVGGAPSSGVG